MLASLRYFAPRLGEAWRYIPGPNALVVRQITPSDESGSEEEAEILAHFAVLVPGFTVERLQIVVDELVTVPEMLRLAHHARQPVARSNFPLLVAASPQPCLGSGVLIAFAEWQISDHLICIDTSALDGRIFATKSPAYLCRSRLLQLADVLEALAVTVFAGDDDQPLLDDVTVHVRTGMTSFVVPDEDPAPVTYTLEYTLASRLPWSSVSTFPAQGELRAFCLAHADGTILFVPHPERAAGYRRQIAAYLGASAQVLRLFPAAPRVRDATLAGLACRTDIAVFVVGPTDCGVLIDARALAAGWHAFPAPGGLLSCQSAIALLRDFAPPGWEPNLQGCAPQDVHVDVTPGRSLLRTSHVPLEQARTRQMIVHQAPVALAPRPPTPSKVPRQIQASRHLQLAWVPHQQLARRNLLRPSHSLTNPF